MSFEQTYNSDLSLSEFSKTLLSPRTSSVPLYQKSEQKVHYSPVPNGSPKQQRLTSKASMSSISPSSSPASNLSGLSTASSLYLQCNSPPSYSSVSPFSMASPTDFSTGLHGISQVSPPRFSQSSSSSGFSSASSQCFSASPTRFSSASPSDFASTDSRTNHSENSEYLNLAVALRNMEVETNKHIAASSCESSNPEYEFVKKGKSFPYATSTNMYDYRGAVPTSHHEIAGTSMAYHLSNVLSTDAPSYCPGNVHEVIYTRYCLTCSQPFCEECSVAFHNKHTFVNFVEFLERAVNQARDAMSDARLGLNVLQTDLEDVQLDAELLDQKAKQAAADVIICTRRLASAVEDREKELLNGIEKARVLKFTSLKAKDEHLRNDKTRLTRAAYKLSKLLESCTVTSNPKEVLASKDMVLAEMFQIGQNRRSQNTREENWISFTGPGTNLLHAINTLGNVMTNNPGPIGEGRAICGNNSSQGYFPYTMKEPKPIAMSRPVSVNSYLVARERHSRANNKIVKVIGDDGEASDNLCRPWGVTCDNRGHIIVADRSNNRIQIYREDGTFVRRFGSQGTGPCQFDRPAGVAVDNWQRIIVADKDNHRIQILQMDGTFVHSFGQKGYRSGQFNYPWDVAVNADCQIAVSDTRNHRVQLFSPDGVFLYKCGYDTTPNMWKHFDSPRGVCFTPEGNLITTDFNNHHLVIIDSWFSNARTIICEGSDGGTKPFLRPQGLVVDGNGNIIVADSRNHRIQVFDSTGRFLWKYGTQGTGVDEMDRPAGIALLPDGKIAIVDFGNQRVLLLEHTFGFRR